MALWQTRLFYRYWSNRPIINILLKIFLLKILSCEITRINYHPNHILNNLLTSENLSDTDEDSSLDESVSKKQRGNTPSRTRIATPPRNNKVR